MIGFELIAINTSIVPTTLFSKHICMELYLVPFYQSLILSLLFRGNSCHQGMCSFYSFLDLFFHMGISKKLGSTNLSLEVLSIHILSYASRLETWFCYQHKGFLVVKVNPLPVSQCPHDLQVYLHVFRMKAVALL